MILFLLASLSMSPLYGHPLSSYNTTEAHCSTLRMLGQSLKDSMHHGSLCVDLQLRTECTTASLEVLKKCLDGGSEFDRECLEEAHTNLTEDNKACFCGELFKVYESLNSVKSLLCDKEATDHANQEEKRQGKSDSGSRVFFSANRADSCCLTAPSRVRFEKTITSMGGGWDGRAGVFTVPVAGTYYFSWNALSPTNEELQLFLLVDSEDKANCYAEYWGQHSCSGSIMLTLRRGNKVTLGILVGSLYETQRQNSSHSLTGFTGYMI